MIEINGDKLRLLMSDRDKWRQACLLMSDRDKWRQACLLMSDRDKWRQAGDKVIGLWESCREYSYGVVAHNHMITD